VAIGDQDVLVAKGHRGGRGSRLAKRSVATGEAGLALRRACLDGSAAFGICFLERARFLSFYNQKPAKTLDIALFCEGGPILPSFSPDSPALSRQ
jgi:hypothetical protein